MHGDSESEFVSEGICVSTKAHLLHFTNKFQSGNIQNMRRISGNAETYLKVNQDPGPHFGVSFQIHLAHVQRCRCQPSKGQTKLDAYVQL